MKRIYGIVATVVALGAVAYPGSCLWAQQPPPAGGQPTYQPQATAAPTPRVAVINMYVVLKGYQKWDFYRKELQTVAKKFEDNDQGYKAAIAKETAKLKEPTVSAKDRDDAQVLIKKYQREMEDNAQYGSKILSEKGEAQVQQMYREVEDAVKRYAMANGIHLVLNYTDLTDQPDFYSARNITRKLFSSGQAGAACPFYIAPGMDISQAIVSMLNQQYPQPGSSAAATPAAAQPGTH